VLAYIPRDRFNTDVRRRIETMLMVALRGEHIDTTVQVGESPLAQLHLIVRPSPGEVVEVDEVALDAELTQIVRNWQDDLRDALVAQHGEERGLQLASHYGRALPTGYIEAASPASAAADVAHLDALEDPADLRIACNSAGRSRRHHPLQVKLYRHNHSLPLSDALPMMENMGLRVVTEHPHRVEGARGTAFIQDFVSNRRPAGRWTSRRTNHSSWRRSRGSGGMPRATASTG
jgi:glutamate dehydrogenase